MPETGYLKRIRNGATAFCVCISLCEAEVVQKHPTLDIPADSLAIPILRRIQTRSGILLPEQHFPQLESATLELLRSERSTSSDSLALLMHLTSDQSNSWKWLGADGSQSMIIFPLVELSWNSGNLENSSDGFRRVGLGAKIYGKLTPWLSYYSRALVFAEYTDKPQFTHQFSPTLGETYSVEKGAGDSLLTDRTFNRYECYLLAKLPYGLTLKAGKNRIHVGPGYFTSLIATRDAPPYWQAEARVDFSTWFHVSNQLLRMTDTQHDIQKYANFHRYEIRPTSNLSFGFSDIVIYQDRSPEVRYLLPLVPLTFIESDMGGPDNTGMAFDFVYASRYGMSVWGEVFIDDLLGPSSFFDNFWENRWATLAGLQLLSPFRGFDADLVIEYSQVEPWTYNGRRPQTSFRHFNVPSASKLGPDSRTWDIQAAYRPLKWLELKTRLGHYDKGTGRQGELGAIHNDSLDGLTKKLLGGDVFKYRKFEQYLNIQYKERAYFVLSWVMDLGDDPFNRLGIEVRGPL